MIFKRRFDGFLSEEHIKKQLLVLAIILVSSFFIFWLISAVFLRGDFEWQEIIALYLDPGVFADSYKEHSDIWFPLIITFVGIFVFTALLITVFTNIFAKISDAYKKGERHYRGVKGHTLILGANEMLIGMLAEMRKDGSTNEILIMTSSPVEALRDKIEAYFGDKKFMDRIIFYFDERDNTSNLEEACACDAKEIYIIGENDEVDHDSVSISCCEKLRALCSRSPHPVHCYLVLDHQCSAEIFHYHHSGIFSSEEAQFRVDVVDLKEYVAEQTLLGMNGEGQLSIDGTGIKPEDGKYLHFFISGMTPMAKAMALTAAHLCHFPNFDSKTGARKTVITFIDYDIRRKRDIFISEHQHLFMLSHYSDIYFDADGNKRMKEHIPDKEYGDFLDIAWEFFDADISSPEAKAYLSAAAADDNQQLAVAICQGTQLDNMSAALHLPSPIYDRVKNIPIYVHLWEQGDAITKAEETRQFGHIYCFGTGSSADRDPLFRKRLECGKRVNYVYEVEYGSPRAPREYSSEESDKRWYGKKESDKFSSIYCANSVPINKHSFGDDLSSVGEALYEVEHRRWLLSALLLGKKAYPSNVREDLKQIVLRERNRYPDLKKSKKLENGDRVSPTWVDLNRVSKGDAPENGRPMPPGGERFHHIDIDPYDALVDQEEWDKDRVLMINSRFIEGQTDVVVD